MNEIIKQYREVALRILKPSQRDIEHGMELHKNSIVCESYGFSPRAAVDGDVVKAAIESGASDAELQDMTEDMRMTRYAECPKEREEYMMAWEAAGVTCILQNAGEEGNSVLRLIKRLARYTYGTDMMRGFMIRARQIGLEVGLRYVYSGNIPGDEGEHTYCYNCGKVLIPRYGYQLEEIRIEDSRCKYCGAAIDGVYAKKPGRSEGRL